MDKRVREFCGPVNEVGKHYTTLESGDVLVTKEQYENLAKWSKLEKKAINDLAMLYAYDLTQSLSASEVANLQREHDRLAGTTDHWHLLQRGSCFYELLELMYLAGATKMAQTLGQRIQCKPGTDIPLKSSLHQSVLSNASPVMATSVWKAFAKRLRQTTK